MAREPLSPFQKFVLCILAPALLLVGLANRFGLIDLSSRKGEIPFISQETDGCAQDMSPSGPLKGAGIYYDGFLLRPRI